MTTASKRLPALVACIFLATPFAAQQPPRVSLIPRFVPGQVLRYQMEFRTISEARVTGAIENPQSPSQVESTVGAQVRLEVLPPVAAGSCEGCIRLRVTYDHVAVATKADVPSPELAENEAQLKNLEGRSFEFTLTADGKVQQVSGPGELAPSEKKMIEDWMVQLAGGSGIPAGGVLPGEKWTAEQPIPAPLRGVLWRSESTYLRDEPCRTVPATGDTCAVILARYEISQREAGGDLTPEEYRLRGLRTAGKFAGSGESLAFISLASGWVISVTQQVNEETDLTVTSVDDNSQVRYTGRIRRQSSMTLLPAPVPSN